MKNEEIRMACAVLNREIKPKHDWYEKNDGYYYKCAECDDTVSWKVKETEGNGPCYGTIFDYPDDLGAMQDFLWAHIFSQAKEEEFFRILIDILMVECVLESREETSIGYYRAMLSARPRLLAEAALKTLGKWNE